MKVILVEMPYNETNLTLYKNYEATKFWDGTLIKHKSDEPILSYVIYNDKGFISRYIARYFKVLEDFRDDKLEELLK